MKYQKFIGLFFAFILLASVIPAEFVSASTPTPQKVNDYSLQVANFIKDKCNGKCDNIILLGDDYVIPSFRRNIPMLNWYSFLPWLPDTRVDSILTDIPYVQRTGKTFAEFDKLFIKTDWMGQESKGKDVVLIIPRDYDSDSLQEVKRFKDMLEAHEYALDISTKYDDEVTCNDEKLWDNFNGVNLFIFGEDNLALNCFPFVARIEDTSFIDINPWDGRNYAVIIQSDSKKVLQTLRVTIDSGEYKKLQSEWVTFVDTGLIIASIAAAFIGADTVVDGVDASFQCFIVQNALACGVSTAVLLVPIVPTGPVKVAVKKFVSYVGTAGEKFILRYSDEAVIILSNLVRKGQFDNFKLYYKELTGFFGNNWDNIVTKLKWSAADEVIASQGAKRVKNLDNFAPHLAKEVQADLLHTVGKADEALKLGDNAVKEIKYVDASDELLDGAPASFDGETIRISKSANIQEVKKVLIPHEMAHAKIFESLSPEINSMLDKKVLEQFDEFLADNLAKSRVSGYTLDNLGYVSDKISVQARYITISIGGGGFEKGAFDIMANDVALAKLYDPGKYKILKEALEDSNMLEKGPKILELSEGYLKNANYITLSSDSLNTISDMTSELRKVT